MIHMNIRKKAFTLVELIVVITILAVLGTIGFINLQWFTSDTRDAVRVSDIRIIEKSLIYFHLKENHYPAPSDSIEVTYSWAVLWNQWEYWDSSRAESRMILEDVTDPLYDKHYAYSVTKDGTQYEIGWVVENIANKIMSNTYAWVNNLNAVVLWNYNWLVLKVSTGGTDYVLAVPSLLSTDTTITDYVEIIAQNKIVYDNKKNIPHSFSGILNETSNFNINSDNLLLFSWNFTDLQYQDNQILLLSNLKEAYSWSLIIDNDATLKKISWVEIDLANPTDLVKVFACNIVNYNLRQYQSCNWLNFITFYITVILNIDITNIPWSISTVYSVGWELWFGSDQWVTLYDWEEWITYQSDPLDPDNSLINNNVTSITKDNSWNYWIWTVNWISMLDVDGNWINYWNDVLVSTHIQYIYTADDWTVWIWTNGGANAFNWEDWESYERAKNNSDWILSANQVTTIFKDSSNNIWFWVQSKWVDRYDPISDTVVNYTEPTLVNKEVIYIYEDSNNNIWFATNGWLSKLSWDPETILNWTSYTDSWDLISNTVTYIFEDSANILWFATSNWLSRLEWSTWTSYLDWINIHLVYQWENWNILVLTELWLTTFDSSGTIISN